MSRPLLPALVGEALGTALLLAAVVGSGIMAERLADGNAAVALLANAIATGAALVVLIDVFGPISGAQFNPAVTLALAVRRQMPWPRVLPYIGLQILGAIAGVWLAHAMFDMPILQTSAKLRSGPGQWLSEIVATATLLTVIFAALRTKSEARLPYSVALTVVAAYWFTASTSFANPAVTLARALTDSFAGIRPQDAPGFILAQMIGVGLAVGLDRWLRRVTPAPLPE
ncbi:aquaporin [Elstera sp.]|jgi:glycerol uptake facilitator-like aquaporin|uniref:aquaporin n=1 Tax=Elstera sp. TaxID=1916664 RepID=UPI0037BFFFFF